MRGYTYCACLVVGMLIGLIIALLWNASEGVCCGPRAARRIDVAYPPGIRVGLTGPWTKNTDPLDRQYFDDIQ